MKKMKKFEISLALGLLVAVLASVFSMKAQDDISRKLVRLHVLANSDSAQDQALKLQVRDAILAEVGEDDDEITPLLLSRIRETAQQAVFAEGYTYKVTVSEERMFFNTRHYDGFSLPAGNYDAVRVLIGEGQGQNWWCVIFPPLCAGVCEAELEEVAKNAGLSADEISFITGDGTVFVLKFKLVELLSRLGRFFS